MTQYVLSSRDKSAKFHFTVKPASGDFAPWEKVAFFGYFEGAPTGGMSNPYNVDYYKATWVATVKKCDVDKLFAWAKANDYRLILR